MQNNENIDERIAKYKAFADMLELARHTEDFFIDLDEDACAFIISGKINNFNFEYYTSRETEGAAVNNDRHHIGIEINKSEPQEITRTIIHGREYTVDSIKEQTLTCDCCGEEILELDEPWKQKEKETVEEKLANGKGKNGHEETAIRALNQGKLIYNRILKEIYTKAPAFFEIAEKYFSGGYLPEKNMTVDFTTNEEIFKDFKLDN